MKTQIYQRLQTILPAAIATIFLLGASGSTFAQPGSGAKYGSRDLTTCADTKAPTKGAITAELAAKYARCTYEKADREDIYLLEDLKVQVGGSVPYNARTYPYMTDITPGAPVYQLRGSYRNYLCAPVSKDMKNRGANCTVFVNTKATGACYKTTFGDWYCGITSGGGSNDSNLTEYEMPPPGFKPDATPVKDKPTTVANVKDNNRTNDVKEAANGNKNEKGYPKPDFSEREKWYEIVKYEYGDIEAGERELVFWYKPKVETRPDIFHAKFFDKDGVLVGDAALINGTLHLTEVGSVAKASARTPHETQMPSVVSVKIVRYK